MSINGLFMIQDVFENYTPNGWVWSYQDYENKGVTDVFKATESTFYADYNNCKTIINRTLGMLEGTNINPYFIIPSFHDANGDLKFDDAQITFIAERAEELLSDIPDIRGLCFDDYYWYGTTEYTESQIEYLDRFAGTVADAMHDINQDSKLTAGINIHHLELGMTVDSFDFIIPMCYRYYNSYPTFIKDQIDTVKAHSNVPIITGLMSYHNDGNSTLWSNKQLERDMRTSIRYSNGYAMFIHPYITETMKFPKTSAKYQYNPSFGFIGKKTSPNFLYANVADCGNTLKSTSGFAGYNITDDKITLDETVHAEDKEYSIRVAVNDYYQGIIIMPGYLTTRKDEIITLSGKLQAEEGLNYGVDLWNGSNSSGISLTGTGEIENFSLQYTPDGEGFNDWNYGTWTNMRMMTEALNTESYFNILELQLEIGDKATEWQEGI